MKKVAVFVKVAGTLKEEKIELTDIDEAGNPIVRTISQKHVSFPQVPKGITVAPLATNPKKPQEQIWLLTGYPEDVVPFLSMVTPLTVKEADELAMKWQGLQVSSLALGGEWEIFEPEK